jgi:hypothetical protein
MMERTAETSPRFKARMAGVCQLMEAVTAAFGEVINPGKLVVAGNATATAANILGHERLFWLGFVLSLIGVAFHIAWALLMYELFKPVNRSLSRLAAFVILVGCATQALTSLLYLAPLITFCKLIGRHPRFLTECDETLERKMRLGWETVLRRFVVAGLTLAVFTSGFAFAQRERDDDDDHGLVLTFSTVGDSRQDPKKPDPSTVPVSGQDQNWLENTKALSRMLRTIGQQRADLLFYDGDMIMGYGAAVVPADTSKVDSIVNSDLMQFYKQYGFWRGMVAGTMEAGTYVFPVAGNHEVQCNSANTKQCEQSGKHAMVQNENAWRNNMGDLIFDDTRFQNIFGVKPSSEDDGTNSAAFDGVTSSQKQLNYSFDFRDSHFTVINTDPYLKDAHAPVKWLEQDLASAKARAQGISLSLGINPRSLTTTVPLRHSPRRRRDWIMMWPVGMRFGT